MNNYWVSWYCPNDLMGKFELHSPWWVSGETMEDDDGKFSFTICAAVQAPDEDGAKRLIEMAHDEPRPRNLEWRFVTEKPRDWSPGSGRFPLADWMKWTPLQA